MSSKIGEPPLSFGCAGCVGSVEAVRASAGFQSPKGPMEPLARKEAIFGRVNQGKHCKSLKLIPADKSSG